MRIRVMLKDPDTMPDAVDDAFKAMQKPEGIDDDEWEGIREERASKAKTLICRKWMEYGEYLSVEFDLDAETAEVIPNGK